MFEIDRRKFGAFVAQLRREKGFTQKQLAQRLYISDKAVSKWETGASIPDTALLMPLAEMLGVSVTELLMCQRMQRDEVLDAGKVETIVQAAIAHSDESPKKKRRWGAIYAASILVGGAALLRNLQTGFASEMMLTAVILGAVFGAYFCFFAKETLPKYYDENRITALQDGMFRMNVPGLRFSNSNWPYMLRAGRIWACAVTGLYPLMAMVLARLWPQGWAMAELWVYLIAILGGLFVPMYIVGKRHE